MIIAPGRPRRPRNPPPLPTASHRSMAAPCRSTWRCGGLLVHSGAAPAHAAKAARATLRLQHCRPKGYVGFAGRVLYPGRSLQGVTRADLTTAAPKEHWSTPLADPAQPQFKRVRTPQDYYLLALREALLALRPDLSDDVEAALSGSKDAAP
jgi:hypothetical protein